MRFRILGVLFVLAAMAPAAPARAAGCPFTPSAISSSLVQTRSGAVYTRVIRPVANACSGVVSSQLPVLLTYTPYGALEGPNDELATAYVPRGYVRVVADVIGTGNSGGCWDDGGARERASAFDLVEALSAAFGGGKVAMIGGSYDGTTANMAAVAAPPHLATIVPEVSIASWYDYSYGDGVRYFLADPAQRQGLVVDEQGFDTPVTFDAGYSLAPSDPRGLQPDASLAQRACPGTDRVDHTTHGYAGPTYDAFWAERDYLKDAGSVTIPVLVAGGWRDYNVKHSESTKLYSALTASPYHMLVMGQGAHGVPESATGFDALLRVWLDHYLRDKPTGPEALPPVVSITNDGVLHKDASWPPPGTADVTFYPHTAGSMDTAPSAGMPLSYTDTQTQTESGALAGMDPGALLFTTAPLTADIRIAGRPRLEVSGTDGPYTPVLFDLGPPKDPSDSLCTFVPAQQACTMSRGFSSGTSVPFVDNDWVVKAGHRIAVAVMSSNLWWAVPDPASTSHTVVLGGDAPTRLVLPVVGGASAVASAGL